MKKSTGKYIIEATKEGFSYYIHHVSKFFAFWVMELATFFGKMTIFLGPVFQKFHIQMCKMVDDSGETNMAKAFDQSDHRKGYRNLLFFDLVWFLVTLAGVAVIMGIAYGLSTIIYNIGFYFNTTESNPSLPIDIGNALNTFTTFLYIPFIVFAVVFVVFALMVKEAGVYASYRNPDLGLSDIIYDAFATLKECGGRLFLVNFLMFLEVLTYAAIIFVPIFIISIIHLDPGDVFYTYYIIWILVPIFSVVSVFVIPVLIGIFRLSVHKFLMDNAKTDAVIIAYRKNENKAKESDFIPLTEAKDINGETIYVEMKKKSKKNKDSDL